MGYLSPLYKRSRKSKNKNQTELWQTISHRKKNSSDLDQACAQPSVPQDDAQCGESLACNHREERCRSIASESDFDVGQARKAQHHAQEQGCESEKRHAVACKRIVIRRGFQTVKCPDFRLEIRMLLYCTIYVLHEQPPSSASVECHRSRTKWLSRTEPVIDDPNRNDVQDRLRRSPGKGSADCGPSHSSPRQRGRS